MTCIEDQRELQFRRLIGSIVMLKLDPPTVLRLQEVGASKGVLFVTRPQKEH